MRDYFQNKHKPLLEDAGFNIARRRGDYVVVPQVIPPDWPNDDTREPHGVAFYLGCVQITDDILFYPLL